MQERFGNRPPEEFRDDQLRPEISPEFRGDFSEQERRKNLVLTNLGRENLKTESHRLTLENKAVIPGKGEAVVEKEVRAEAKEVSVGALFLVEQFLGKTQEIHS